MARANSRHPPIILIPLSPAGLVISRSTLMAVAPGISDASEPTGENQYRAGSSKSFMSMLPELVINLFVRRLNTGRNRVAGDKNNCLSLFDRYDSSRSDGDCTHSPTAGSVLRFNSSANMARRGRLATCGADFDGREGSASAILKVQPQASWLI
ncbi:hypothetical protein H4Q26_006189 [Puccinia striiformis f. sp. tritici PST-130]|uniref:Uncharacterized protein n=1 Tax=Puccinia striiformis f. sp. tritici PST-78 TaxID=1165861 RepID=A0A0L0VXL8_9BASI|nr:hypothetical protein H4Q26_006189 [Puccinia striiformis f. sp. tritici PST-130]KNF04001.1 hypothetical protein PSTG_02710 [Puccinia striiformis f. sp. tritici PST-78]